MLHKVIELDVKNLKPYFWLSLCQLELAHKIGAMYHFEKGLEGGQLKAMITGYLEYFKLLILYLKHGDKNILDRQPLEICQTFKEMIKNFQVEGEIFSSAGPGNLARRFKSRLLVFLQYNMYTMNKMTFEFDFNKSESNNIRQFYRKLHFLPRCQG